MAQPSRYACPKLNHEKSGTHSVPLSFGSFCSFLQAGAESGNAADVVRRCAAAAANEARARFVPLAHEVVIRCRASVPCLRHGIVRLACIRVDDDGLRGVRADIADEVGHVLRCRTVDAEEIQKNVVEPLNEIQAPMSG